MSIHRGPNTKKGGLVFGYDTGYGAADNSTPTRHYHGEPTTNLFSNPNFDNHTDVTVGTTSVIKQDFGDGRIGIQMIQASTSNIAGFSMGSYSAPVSAGTYTWSSFIHSTSTGGKVKAQVTVYVNGTRHWLTNSNTWTTSVTECSHLFISTVANQWHRIDNQFTLPTGTLTNLQLGSFYRTTSNFTIKIANAQLELKSHTTPYVSGTRLSTESIIDLKRTTDINVSNISFNSTGQPTFDGTNDYFVTDNSFLITGDQTWEVVAIANGGPNSPAGLLTNHQYTSPQSNFGINYVSGNRLGASIGYTNGTREYSSKNTNYVIQVGVPFHAALKYDSSNNTIEWFINGISDSTYSLSATPNFISQPICSGRWTPVYTGYYFNGEVYVGKVYGMALTPEEIKQNFNTYKNRFNI